MFDFADLVRWAKQTARLAIGFPDYETYVARHELLHPGQPAMTYEEFFRDRQMARYAFHKGKIRGCS